MTKTSYFFPKLVLLTLIMSIAFGVNAQPGAGETFGYHDETGMARFVGADSGVIPAPSAIAGQSFDKTATFWLNNYSRAFGANSGQMMIKSINNNGTRASVRYDQVYNGIPVYGAEIVVNVTANGDLIGMGGEVSPALNLSTSAQVSASSAAGTAIAAVASRMDVDANTLSAYSNALTIFDGRLIGAAGNTPALSYAVEVTNGGNIDAIVFVDANTSAVRLLFNRVDNNWNLDSATYVGRAPSMLDQARAVLVDVTTYDSENTTTWNTTLLCDETSDVVTADSCTSGADADADNAHYHAAGFADFLYDEHGRNSIDDAGFGLISTVHYDVDYCNAFWNGSRMTYGDGCPLVVDDVIGHELTHGFTEFSSNLVYFDQSGAINESLSDIWGEVYDQAAGGHEGPADGNDYTWRLGEELSFGYTDSEGNPLVGLRDMKDPTIFGDPGAVNDGFYWHSSADNRGVHINSGISNKTAYLMADGGEYSGVSLNGIGVDKMLAVFYEVQTNWFTYGSNFKDMGTYLWQGCNALASEGTLTQADCNQVAKAAAATQLHQTPIMDAGPVADACPAGHSVAQVWMTEDFNSLFFPDFSPEWDIYTQTAFSDDDPYVVGFNLQAIDAETGNFYMAGADNGFYAWAEAVALTPVVPDVYPTFMHFDLEYRYEYYGRIAGTRYGWDSGHVNAYDFGDAAAPGAPAFTFLEPDAGIVYDGVSIAANDWGSGFQPGWIDYSGPGSVRVPLSDYAGNLLYVGFSSISDSFFAENGMNIDNVSVYTCIPDAVSGGEFEDKALDGWAVNTRGGGDKVKCNRADKGKIFSYSGDCAFQLKASNVILPSVLKYKVKDTDANENDQLMLSAKVMSKGGNKLGRFIVKAVYLDPVNGRTVEKLNVPFAKLDLNGYTSVEEALTLETVGTPDKIVTKVIFNERASSGKLFIDDLHVWLLKDEMSAASSLASSMLAGITPTSSDAPRRVDDSTRDSLPLPEAPSGFRD